MPFSVFHEHLSQVTIHHAQPIIGETAVSWVARINPTEIDGAKRQTVSSLRTLQAATTQQKQQIDEFGIPGLGRAEISLRYPGGLLLKKADRDTFAGFCWANLRSSSTANARQWVSSTSYVRPGHATRTGSRPSQDAIDLQHTVLGLSYCDVLVTERYAYSTAAYAIKALAPLPLATLHRRFGPDILDPQRPAGGQ